MKQAIMWLAALVLVLAGAVPAVAAEDASTTLKGELTVTYQLDDDTAVEEMVLYTDDGEVVIVLDEISADMAALDGSTVEVTGVITEDESTGVKQVSVQTFTAVDTEDDSMDLGDEQSW